MKIAALALSATLTAPIPPPTEEPEAPSDSDSDSGSDSDPDSDPDPDPEVSAPADPDRWTDSDSVTDSDPEASAPADPDRSTDSDSDSVTGLAPTPSTSVWRTSDPPPPATHDPQAQPQFRDGVAPGGYWDPGEAPEIAPNDGAEQRLAGTIMVPLGLLTVASAAPMIYLTMPGHCMERTSKVGFDLDAKECEGLLILNSIRVGYGALAVISGAVLLGIGIKRKRELEEWKRRRFRAGLVPGRAALSAHFSFRF
jgi:hypothetical protein